MTYIIEIFCHCMKKKLMSFCHLTKIFIFVKAEETEYSLMYRTGIILHNGLQDNVKRKTG